MKLSLLVPVLNESAYFRTFWQGLLEAPLDQCGGITEVEILVVDAGSTDGTVALVRELAETESTLDCGIPTEIRILERAAGQNSGAGIREAIEISSGDIVLIQDANPGYFTSDYPALLRPILEDYADAVFGNRAIGFPQRIPRFRRWAKNRITAWLINVLVNARLTGLRPETIAMKGELARSLRLTSARFEVQMEIAARLCRGRARMCEVPVKYRVGTHDDGTRTETGYGLAALWAAFLFSVWDREAFKPGLNQTLNTLDEVCRWIYEPILRRLLNVAADSKRPLRILEIGSGIGSLTKILLKRGDVVACDISPDYMDKLTRRFRGHAGLQAHLWDATGPPLEEWPKFDVVVAFNVLEHLEHDVDVLQSWSKLLVPGGALILLVPNSPRLYSPIDAAVGHYRRYTKKSLMEKLEAAGLQPAEVTYHNPLGVLGWLVNGVWLQRSQLPSGQLWLYSTAKPILLPIEAILGRFTGLSLACIARPEPLAVKEPPLAKTETAAR